MAEAADVDDDGNSFPQIVAWVGLVLALLLFFGNTVPAVRERNELRATADELKELRRRYDAAIEHARAGTSFGDRENLQSVLVAIDRIGWTPAELLACYPPDEESPAPAPGSEGSSPGPAARRDQGTR